MTIAIIIVLALLVLHYRAAYVAESKRYLDLWHRNQKTLKSLRYWQGLGIHARIRG